ncbi:MAG: NADH-quinone oxidoreductase subunit NuoN [Legionellaceae bacterium]|nr:NADH-quinone oxidoreductase subunit NuoN [Legionellaceae bacterium]HCA88824.1 NADH-quinone oxidoreductase subunit NuoN [Legionellales bacterium]|tara:strand:+ start:9230 stop:10669 length:1440 start_codon:yes stop_codon:yes gene_type:complete
MMSLVENIQFITPELIIISTALLALLGDLFLKKHVSCISFYISCIGLIAASIVSLSLFGNYKMIVFNGLFIIDDASHLMKLFIYLNVFLCFSYSYFYLKERQMPIGDYFVLALFSTLGMMVLVSAHSLLTLYLGVELLSLPLYALTAMRRSQGNASEAALKYFVMGAIASGMLLYGFSLIYGVTGELDLLNIANQLAIKWQQQHLILSFAIVFIITGLGFKLAAAPFHMWAPDVYQGAPTSVTLFISAAPKIAAVGMTLRLLSYALPDLVGQWQQILLVMSLLSVGLGNLLAVTQTKIKRLLAYSAIAHTGYTLFGILAATPAGYAASLYYILIYSLTSAAAFGLLTLLSRDGVEIELVEDLRGLNKRNPWLAFLMLIVLFSMAGIPPTAGFFTKLLVLKSLVDVQMTWVAILGLLFAVVGVYYYILLIKTMYFDEIDYAPPINLNKPHVLLYSINALALLYFGLFPALLIENCYKAFY